MPVSRLTSVQTQPSGGESSSEVVSRSENDLGNFFLGGKQEHFHKAFLDPWCPSSQKASVADCSVRVSSPFLSERSLRARAANSRKLDPSLQRQSALAFTAFVGVNLFQFGLTNFCPMALILKRLGVPESNLSCSTQA